jgi:hypothetical protein
MWHRIQLYPFKVKRAIPLFRNGGIALVETKNDMTAATIEIVRAALKADPSIGAAERARILNLVRNPEATPTEDVPVVLRRKEVARRLGRTLRSVDQLCEQGILEKVHFAGRTRACGILESSLAAAITPQAQ